MDEDERAGEPGGVPQDDLPRDDLAEEALRDGSDDEGLEPLEGELDDVGEGGDPDDDTNPGEDSDPDEQLDPDEDSDEVEDADADTDPDSWEGLTEDLPDAEDLELEEAADVPAGWWRPTWALVMALSFATLQVLGVVVGLGTVVFDLVHDNPALDGVLARGRRLPHRRLHAHGAGVGVLPGPAEAPPFRLGGALHGRRTGGRLPRAAAHQRVAITGRR